MLGQKETGNKYAKNTFTDHLELKTCVSFPSLYSRHIRIGCLGSVRSGRGQWAKSKSPRQMASPKSPKGLHTQNSRTAGQGVQPGTTDDPCNRVVGCQYTPHLFRGFCSRSCQPLTWLVSGAESLLKNKKKNIIKHGGKYFFLGNRENGFFLGNN